MKTFAIISGLIFIVGSFSLLPYQLKKIDTYKYGHEVEVKINYVPNCLTSNTHYNIKFEFEDKIYAKEIGVLPCRSINAGDILKLKTNGDHSVFLYQNENPYLDLQSNILLGLMGLGFMIWGIFRYKNASTQQTV
jgi:hypothetical protein